MRIRSASRIEEVEEYENEEEQHQQKVYKEIKKYVNSLTQQEHTLNHLAQTDPAFAQRMFNNLYECVGGYGPGCMAKTPYTFAGEKITACHGKVFFNMNLSEFEDVKHFIDAVNEITSMGGSLECLTNLRCIQIPIDYSMKGYNMVKMLRGVLLWQMLLFFIQS